MVLAERHPVEARPFGRLCLVAKAVDGTSRVAFGQMHPERHRAAAQRLPCAHSETRTSAYLRSASARRAGM